VGINNLIDFIDKQGGKDWNQKLAKSNIFDFQLQRQTNLSVPLPGFSPAASHSKQPSVGCVGSITWQGALQSPPARGRNSLMKLSKPPQHDRPQHRPQLASKAVKREHSVDSSASTTDSDANSDKRLPASTDSDSGNSRPPSRGGSSCGSLDVPDSLPDVGRPFGVPDFVWDVSQFNEGKADLEAVTQHLKSNDPAVRRSVLEGLGEATENATLQCTEAMTECLADSDNLVRKAAVKSLSSVLSLAKESKVSELAQRMLADAAPISRFDAVEALLPFAIQGNNSTRAFKALDWYRSQDQDPSIRVKAERSLLIVARCKKQKAVRCARAAMDSANDAMSRLE
jgi:hypothetical protein